jgi:hypothetical protein
MAAHPAKNDLMSGTGTKYDEDKGLKPLVHTDSGQQKPPPLHSLTRLDAALAAVTFALGMALYVRTLAPSLLLGDSAELQTLAYTLGMTHPTGYPIYLLVGKLFTLLPVGSIAYRVNLASAFFGALTLALLYLAGRLLGGWRMASFAGVVMLGVFRPFWFHAVIAELYTAAAALVASILLLVLLWRKTDDWRCLAAAGLIGGLSLGVHNTVALSAPAVLVYLALLAPRRRAWAAAVMGAALGILLALGAFFLLDALDAPSSYYNSVARPSLSVWGLSGGDFDSPFERLAFLYAARQFRPFMFSLPPDAVAGQALVYGRLLMGLLRPFGMALAALGWVMLLVRRWREGVLITLAWAATVAFAINYGVGDFDVFFIPGYVPVALAVTVGVASLLDGAAWLLRRAPDAISRRAETLAGIAGAAILLGIAWADAPRVLESWQAGRIVFIDDTESADYPYPVAHPEMPYGFARVVVDRLEDDAIVFTDWDMLYAYYYVAHVEQGRTGIAFHETYPQDDVDEVADSAVAYIDANLGQRPIYVTDRYSDFLQYYELHRVGSGIPLYRVAAP